MRVGFFTVFRKDPQHYVLAEIMVRSVRAAMPGVEIVQFTDETSPAVPGVDAVRRKPNGRMLERRLEHYADCDGDWLLLDTDVVVRSDVREIFSRGGAWAVALADRNWPHIAQTPELTAEMPYNTGVVFSCSSRFWRDVLEHWRGFTTGGQADWLSEQRAVAAVVKRGAYGVLTLPGMTYNYPPAKADDQCEGAKIAHYKGIRKAWMRDLKVGSAPSASGTEQALKDTAHHYSGAAPPLDLAAPPSVESPIRVFIGYDPRQPVAFHVAAHSVQTRASAPVSVTRLQLNQLPIVRRGLTEFTYSRFLVPYLSGFKGWSVFLDADMLCLADIKEVVLASMRATSDGHMPLPGVHVVQSERRFEWASLMVFDNARCSMLTPAYVENPNTPLFDLSFSRTVGSLPASWNHLVGYDRPNPDAKVVHFTQGIPIWPETDQCEFAAEWRRERDALIHSVSFQDLMGGSVHVQHMAVPK